MCRILNNRFYSPGLYLHLPFCAGKCAYCDFTSGVYPEEIQDVYLSALKKEFRKRCELFPSGFKTVYAGGGSPSSLEGERWLSLVEFLKTCVKGGGDCEFTIEMNPSQVTEEKLLSIEGVATRISLGAQTFEPSLRKILGRKPVDPVCIEHTVDLIKGRFDLNLDLIHSVPGQTIELLERDLQRIKELDIDHVSAYALMLEEGTPLHRQVKSGEIHMVDEAFEVNALSLVRKRLGESGFSQYEISNFAQPGKECRHNLATWAGCEYLGLGAGACSCISGERDQNEPDVMRYIELVSEKGEAVCARETLDKKGRAGELAMLSLRTITGIQAAHFKSETGFDPFSIFEKAIARHTATGLLEVTEESIRLTEAGLDLADLVMMDFLSP